MKKVIIVGFWIAFTFPWVSLHAEEGEPKSSPVQIWKASELDQKKIDGISLAIQTKIREDFEKTKKAVRDAHAKHHGCVNAEFTVLEGLNKKGLDVGLFKKPGKTYKAWIRFSNGSGDPKQDDRNPGGRGMAFKLFGVEGDKFLDDEKLTQDFNMINHPVFFVKNLNDYGGFLQNAPNFFATHAEERAVVTAIANPKLNPPMNPLESVYFSMTPRQWGPADKLRPVKFSAAPVACDTETLSPLKLEDSPDALRIALRKTLEQKQACFVFRIQLQTNEKEMPVDNPVQLWDEKLSPFIPVAKIVIKKQSFESEKQETFCEDLSITPWHSIAEHQPLGSIELTRKAVYQGTSKLRHELNGRAKQEPTGEEVFE